jgi:hypothetical protein
MCRLTIPKNLAAEFAFYKYTLSEMVNTIERISQYREFASATLLLALPFQENSTNEKQLSRTKSARLILLRFILCTVSF